MKVELSSHQVNVEISKKVNDGLDYVRIGEDDNYFAHLIELYKNSKTHRRCINSIINYAYGERGLFASNANDLPLEASLFFKNYSKQDQVAGLRDLRIFKMFALECFVNKGGKIIKFNHFPLHKLRPEPIRLHGKITQWFYSPDFSKLPDEPNDWSYYSPVPIPVIDEESKVLAEGRYIYVFRPDLFGSDYISSPDYEAVIPDIQSEWEMAIYLLYQTKTSFAGATIVRHFDGKPSASNARTREEKFAEKYSGGRGQRIIHIFGDDKETTAEIENIAPSDAPDLYDMLEERTVQAILTGHGFTSKELLGIDTKTGFSSNADIMLQAYELMKSTEIRAFQNMFIRGHQALLDFNKWDLKLDMEAFDLENVIKPIAQDENTEIRVNEHLKNLTGRQQQNLERIVRKYNQGKANYEFTSSALKSGFGLDEEQIEALLNPKVELKKKEQSELDSFIELGEDEDLGEWDLIDERKVDGEPQPIKLATVPSSQWKAKSEQDNELLKVRYQYAGNKNAEREFCQKMMRANKVYRYEDIQQASSRVVNPGWGPKGADTYDLWLYKGGGNCKHFWKRKIYLRKNNKSISVNKARQMINEMKPNERGEYRLPINDQRVAKIPFDQTNRGFLPSNPQGR